MNNNHIFVIPAPVADADVFIKWGRRVAGFDPATAYYPSSVTYKASSRQRAVAYMTFQKPLMLETIISNPEASTRELAGALKALTQTAVTDAAREGRGEVYFLCADESTIEFAKHQLYEELPYKVYRIKLSDLHANPQQNQATQSAFDSQQPAIEQRET